MVSICIFIFNLLMTAVSCFAQATLNATNATWQFMSLGQTVHAFTEPTMPIVDTNVPTASVGALSLHICAEIIA